MGWCLPYEILKKLSLILAIIIILISALVWWQFENIKSVYYWYKYDNQNVGEMIDDRNNDVDKYIKGKSNLNVRQSTEAEEKLHQEELITDDELVDVLTGKTDVKEMFGQVEVVLSELDAILKESGQDRTLVNKIRQSYNDEKSLKKAYCLNLFNRA